MQSKRKNSILLIALLFTLLISVSFVSAHGLDDSNNIEATVDNDESVIESQNEGLDDISSASDNDELKDSSQVVETIPQADTGVVSGGVDLTTFNGRTTTGSVVYTVPVNQTNLKSAIVVVNVYSGSGAETYGLYSNVTLNTNNGLEVLGYETLTFDTNLANNPNVYYVNDHTTKQYSDYQMVYDITNKVKNLNPGDTITVGVENTKIPDKLFDGNIKLIGLFYAYDDGDEDKYTYWLHLGQLWRSATTGNFNFATQNYNGKTDDISLRTIALSSSLADSYKINNNEITPTSVTPGDYYSNDIKWDNIAYAFSSGSETNFSFEKSSGSYKTNVALLVVREQYETAPITEVYVNYATGSDDYAGTSSENSFKTIEHALSVIEPNGIIHLSGVNYLDNVGVDGISIDKNVSIIGMGDDAVIDANNNGRIFSIGAYTVNLSNLAFVNANVAGASDKRGGALWVNGATLTVDNCKFINNTAGTSSSYGGAINLKSATATIRDSYFENNSAWYAAGAINAENSNVLLNITGSTFTNNVILNNGWSAGAAICAYNTVIIDRSMFYGNRLTDTTRNGKSINEYSTGSLTITNSVLLDGEKGVWIATGPTVLENNWWGNNDTTKDTNPKDLGYTNADVTSYLYLNMVMYATGMDIDDVATVNINLVSSDDSEFDMPNLPATIAAVNGDVNPETTTLVNGIASVAYTITEVGNNAVTVDVLGIKDTVTLSSEDVVSTAIVYVNSTGGSDSNSGNSWENAFKTIEKAVSAVEENGTIYVADGSYQLGDSVPAAGISINKNIAIIGQSTNAVISGGNAKRIFTIGVDCTLNITKLTLTEGKGTYGGAIQIEDGGNTNPVRQGYLIISDSIISNSHATTIGGAIGTNRGTISNINNVTFVGNSAPIGGAVGSSQKGTVNIGENCKFIENSASGRGSVIYAQAEVTTGKNNLFYGNIATGNYGYGAIFGYGFDIGPANVFINNKAAAGGSLYLGGNRYSGTGSYCIFINNTDNDGYTIAKQSKNRPVTLNNCYWGTNTPDFSALCNGAITYTNYLVLNISSDSDEIHVGENAVITVDLTKNQNGGTADINSLPGSLPLVFTVVNGNVNPITTELVNGVGTTTYSPSVMGEGSVTANIYAVAETYTLNVLPEAGTVFVNSTGGLDTNAGDSWANAVKTIKHALEIVGENRTIYVADGIYYLEDVSVDGLTIDKNVSIIGMGDNIVIDANNNGRIFNIDGSTVTLNNLIFTHADVSNATVKRGGALYVTSSILNIDNCKFIDNTAGISGSYSGAINLIGSNTTISNSYFENNTAWYGGSAINAQSGNIFVNIQNSQFINNRALNTGYAMGGALMIYGDSIINRSVLFNNSLGDKSRANAGQAINYGQGNHVLVNSVLIGEGLLTVNLGNSAVVSLEDNWWGNNDTTKDTNPKDLGHTNGNVESYLVLSSTIDKDLIFAGDLVTVTTTLGNVIELPVVFDANLGSVTPNEATILGQVVSTYNATDMGDVIVTVDVLGIKNEIKFTVKESLPNVAIAQVKTPWNDGIYPGVNNTFTITLNNLENDNVEGLVLEVYSNETGELIASYTIDSLVAGTSTISVTDPTIRQITEQTVWPAAQNNKIRFTFNLMRGEDLASTLSVDKMLAYNGYLNKTYSYGGHDNIINRNYTITGDIIIATQDESVYMDQFSRFRNETWNIETPEDAENIRAFLYFNYNWDTSFFPNGWSLTFNDVEITADYISYERDRGNLGGWGAYDYGLLVFDVTEYYKANQNNSFVIEKTGNCALYPSTLYVLYDMPNSHVTKDVYFSDICDVFYPNYNMNGYDDLIKFVVDYNGLNLENMTEATWYVFSGSSSTNNILLFNDKEENAFIGRTSNSCYALELDVTDYISENNKAWFISTNRSTTTVAYEQVLVITKVSTVETSIEITSIQGNGTILGILKDNSGLGVANQIINLTVDGTSFASTVTNDAGEFTIIGKNGVNNIIFEGDNVFLTSIKSITLTDIASNEETNKTISDLEKQLEEAQANATALADELAEAKANLTAADEEIAGLESDLTKANEKVANLTSQLENITAQLANKTSEVANLTDQLAEAQANATALADELAEAKANLTTADERIAGLESALAEANQKVGNLTDQLAEANSNITSLTEKLSTVTTQLAEAQANATALADELADAKANLTAAEAKIADLTNKLADANNNITNLTDKLANITAQLEEAQKQIQNLSSELIPTAITANALKIKALNSGNFQVTLKDNKGNALANKTVSIIINGVTKQVTTDANGIAKLSVKYSTAGIYNAVVTFLGDKTYSATVATGKITVTKKATKITAPKKKFKVKKKTKKVKITLKSEGKALAKKKITLTVKGKTFKAKTNSKGVATIKVKLNKRGTFKYKVKFAGDGAYKAISKKGKIVIKK